MKNVAVPKPSRRQFLAASAGAFVASTTPVAAPAENLRVATFRFDVTPPKGHGLCGGWIKPVVAVDDTLEAIGLVILGAGMPIVICAIDWTGILNSAHLEWRRALAEAAGTDADRVAVQCVHQHNAPFACLETQAIIAAQKGLPATLDVDFFRRSLDRARDAVRKAVARSVPFTAVGTSSAKVAKVASNRRVLGPDGKIAHWRGSSSRNPVHHELPEGLIDPFLKTVAFYSGAKKVAACHYYATHPMSYYGDGRVSSDFVGLARKARQKAEPGCTHVYFTGCAGNIACGKYNDGSKERRSILMRRLLDAIVAADAELEPRAIDRDRVEWRTEELLPSPRKTLDTGALRRQIADRSRRVVGRNRPSFTLAYLERLARKEPILLSSLRIGSATLLHLPAESFVEYQLRAQKMAEEDFIATAAYGDGGPWYIPTREAYPQGGYEVSVAFSDPSIDEKMTRGIEKLLS